MNKKTLLSPKGIAGATILALVIIAGLIYGSNIYRGVAPADQQSPTDQEVPLPLVENTFFWKDYSEKAFDALQKQGLAKEGIFSGDNASPRNEQDWTGDGVPEGFFETKTANQYAVLQQTEDGVGFAYAYPTFESPDGTPFIVKKDSYKHNLETNTIDVAFGEGSSCKVIVYKWEQVKKGFVLQDGATGDASLCK